MKAQLQPIIKSSRWLSHVIDAVRCYVSRHRTFYLEELKDYLEQQFPERKNTSLFIICRALRFEMGLSRNMIIWAARESVPDEVSA